MIHKLLYCTELALRNIRRFRFISIVRFASAFFLMIVISLFLSSYYGSVSYINDSLNYSDILLLNMYIAENPDELPISENSEFEFEIWSSQNRIVFDDYYISNINLVLLSNNFNSVYRNFISCGNYISDPLSQCVVGESVAIKYDISLGDTINIGSRDYITVGFTAIPKYSSKILLCDPSSVQTGYPQMYYYWGDVRQIGSGITYKSSEITEYFKKFLQNDSIFISMLIPFTFIIIYSLIAISNINSFYLYKTQTAVIIKQFVGAQRWTIFCQKFIENMIVFESGAAIAYLFSFPMIDLLKSNLKYITLNLELPSVELIILLLFAGIFTFFISCKER